MRFNRPVAGALVSPILLLLVFGVIIPAGILLTYSVYKSQAFKPAPDFNLDSYQAVFNTTNRTFALNTLYIALPTMLVSVGGGFAIAYYARFSAGRARLPLLALVVIAMLGSFLVRMYAWRTLLGAHGIINGLFEQLGFSHGPLGFLLFNRGAVIAAEVNYLMPFCTIVLYAALSGVSDDMRTAARDLGARRIQTLRRVTLPLVGPAILGAASFTFFLSCGDYITPSLLGGNNSTTFGTLISDQLRVTGNFPLGAALSFVLIATFVLFYLLLRGLMRLAGLLPKSLGDASA